MVYHVSMSGDIKYNHNLDKNIVCCWLLILNEIVNLLLAMVGNVP